MVMGCLTDETRRYHDKYHTYEMSLQFIHLFLYIHDIKVRHGFGESGSVFRPTFSNFTAVTADLLSF